MRDTLLASEYIKNFRDLEKRHLRRLKKEEQPVTAFMKHNRKEEPLLMYFLQKKNLSLSIKKSMILCICNKQGSIQEEISKKSMRGEGKTVMDIDLDPEIKNFLSISIDEDKELEDRS